MAGFMAPGMLFLRTGDQPERDFILAAAKRLRGAGFNRVVEPCAGAFAMSAVLAHAGFKGPAIHASDVTLYSAIHGYGLADRDLSELGVRLDGELIQLTGDSLDDAAILLFAQARARMEAKPEVDYWKEIVKDMSLRAEAHVDGLRKALAKQRKMLDGMHYETQDMWVSMREVADDPQTIVTLNPPSYRGGYEKFFDTCGRLTWDAEIEYDLFDPEIDPYRMAAEFADAPAVFLVHQQTEPGNYAGDVLHARHINRGEYVYIWSNKAPYLRQLAGKSAVGRPGPMVKLDVPMIPHDHEIKADSTIAIGKVTAAQSRYYKDLWMHRQDYKMAGYEFALYVDGYLAGMAGFDTGPIIRPYNEVRYNAAALVMTYATGAPHASRLTRLITMVALQRDVIESVCPPWVSVQIEQVCTVDRTPHPEAMRLRGIMKLDERVPDKTYGYRLVYVSDPIDRTLEQTLAEWKLKEERYERQKAKQAA